MFEKGVPLRRFKAYVTDVQQQLNGNVPASGQLQASTAI